MALVYPFSRVFAPDVARTDRRRPAAQAGYAVVDAMMALMILSSAIILSLLAMDQARQTIRAAAEARRAQDLMTLLLETGPRQFEDVAGRKAGFAWRLETRPTGADRPIEICLQAVSLESLSGARKYQATTLVTCPEVAPV